MNEKLVLGAAFISCIILAFIAGFAFEWSLNFFDQDQLHSTVIKESYLLYAQDLNGVKRPQLGTYFPSSKTIAIYTSGRPEKELIHTCLHEVGHALDHRAGMLKFDSNRNEMVAEAYANSWTCKKSR